MGFHLHLLLFGSEAVDASHKFACWDMVKSSVESLLAIPSRPHPGEIKMTVALWKITHSPILAAMQARFCDTDCCCCKVFVFVKLHKVAFLFIFVLKVLTSSSWCPRNFYIIKSNFYSCILISFIYGQLEDGRMDDPVHMFLSLCRNSYLGDRRKWRL